MYFPFHAVSKHKLVAGRHSEQLQLRLNTQLTPWIPVVCISRVQLCYWVISSCLKPNSMKHFCPLQHLPAHLNFECDLKDNKITQNQLLFTKGWIHWFTKDGSHQSIPCLCSCLGKHLKIFLLDLSST